MPLSVTCPGCGARLNAPDAAAGKSVRCPGCQAAVRVPAADRGFEVVDDAPARPAPSRPPAARPVAAAPVRPARSVNDDDDDRPRPTRNTRRSRGDEEGDEDDRPRPAKASRRSRDGDDESDGDDDRPRKKKKKGGVPVWVFAAGGGAALVFLLVVGGAAAYLLSGAADPTPPPGWSLAKSAEGNYQVFLPGPLIDVNEVKRRVEQEARRKGAPVHNSMLERGHSIEPSGFKSARVDITSYPAAATLNLGPDPESLYKLLTAHHLNLDAKWNYPVEKTPVTLGGKPALEVRVRKNPFWMVKDFPKDDPVRPPPANLPPEHRRMWEENQKKFNETRDEHRKGAEKQAQDETKTAEHAVYYVTTNGKRVVIIQWHEHGEYPPADKLKILIDSFKFI